MPQAFSLAASQELLPGQLSLEQPFSPLQAEQLSAWLPVLRHASRASPQARRLLLQPLAQRVQAQALQPLRSWACVHVFWELDRRALRALLPSWLFRGAAVEVVAAVPAENTAPKT